MNLVQYLFTLLKTRIPKFNLKFVLPLELLDLDLKINENN